MTSSGFEFGGCTIIAKNYLPMARALVDSWRAVHPDAPFFVLVLDSPQGFFNPEAEVFQTVLTPELDIPNLDGFLFKYSVLEASTAVKPYLLNYLFRRYSVAKLLYLDPDILILNALDGLKDRLDKANILLTPHLLSPLPNDGRGQTEHDILQAGTYNLGFIGLNNSLESSRLLKWWSDKLYHHCIVAFDKNLFVDQRWVDMVPGLFDGVEIVRDPGYNVAYWNLSERAVSVSSEVKVNGRPLYFFHFSGFNPDQPSSVSKYQTRYTMANVGEARQLYSRYRDLLVEKGWDQAKGWTYGHDFFSNGIMIPASARQYYWSLGPDVLHLGNPFSWMGNGAGSEFEPLGRMIGNHQPPGINLLGQFAAENYVSEEALSSQRVVQATGLPNTTHDWVDSGPGRLEPASKVGRNEFRINLLVLSPQRLQRFATEHHSYLNGHFNMGYWACNLAEFPAELATALGWVDEVWTPSVFSRDAVAAASPVPVKVVPYSIDPSVDRTIAADRSPLGLSPAVFTFLSILDARDCRERKNPAGLIAAYRSAFGERKDVQLLIQASHGEKYRDELVLLQRQAGAANVRILDSALTTESRQQLIGAADAYVSLHRAEAFGLTLAEAMMWGKPVIATGYSGNLDFMADDDSFLVPYRLVAIDHAHGFYKAGQQWADPDLDYAVDILRSVESHREAAAARGMKARAKVRELLDPGTIGTSVRGRLEELGLLADATTMGPGTAGDE